MWGHVTKHFKSGVALLLVLAALAVGWALLARVWFFVIVACVGSVALLAAACRISSQALADVLPRIRSGLS